MDPYALSSPEDLADQIKEAAEQKAQATQEARANLRRLTAPVTRAGYIVAGIIGLLVFWFLTTYVFEGNRTATGILVIATALFFLAALKSSLEKNGTRHIADVGGAVIGLD